MSKEKTPSTSSGIKTKKAEQSTPMRMNIIRQYLKDMSFENPNAPEVFQNTTEPKMQMDVNVEISKTKTENVYESCLQVRATLEQGNGISFVIEVAYAGLVEIIHDNEDMIKKVLLTDIPNLLFPYVRQIVSNISIQGGFPPLNMAPINFHNVNEK